MDLKGTLEQVKRKPVIRTVVAVQQRYGEEGAGLFASAIAFHAFFSLFPLLLVASAALGFIVEDPQTRADIVRKVTSAVPGLGSLVGESLDAIVDARAATGVLGILGFVWTGTGVVRAAGHALTKIFRIEIEGDNPIKQNAWALGSLGMLGIIVAVSTGVSVLGSSLPSGNVPLSVLLIGVGGVVDLGMFIVAYRVLTRGRGPSTHALLPGAILATVGWTVLKLVGAWYARRTVAGATAIYGTFAATIGVLVLLSLAGRIFLYGAILNVVRMRRDPSLQTGAMEIEDVEDPRRTGAA